MQRKYYPYLIKNKVQFGNNGERSRGHYGTFSEQQQKLYWYMEKLSEKYFYARWRSNLEYFLWYELKHPTYLNDQERKRLWKLAKRANSWGIFLGIVNLKTWARFFRKNKGTWHEDWTEMLEADEERL